jgi:hypothetical protein
MSSWSVKLALDGFAFSLPEGRLGFAPKINREDYRTFWSTGTGWGCYSQRLKEGEFRLEALYGSQTIRRLELADLPPGRVKVMGPAGDIPAKVKGKAVVFEKPVTLKADEELRIECA